ncbi:MAG: carboxypeptidase regulatory-like domain-containing protein [Chloroflexi bacterium]|nr:carboxypeptidase regulatory-like domain-containing protein [Chloroflexota bacterium]
MAATALLLGACTPATAPSPSAAPPSQPPPTAVPTATGVLSTQAAAALVLSTDPRFAGIEQQNQGLIGQCCSWTATPTATGYAVVIEIGWGDCPAGCINRHHWFYAVNADGTVTLDHEDGPPVPAGVPGPADGTAGGPGIRGIATAGPVCPVVRPNDPNCADRPVAGATVHVLDVTGLEVATLQTDASGSFVVTLPPGQYRVQADAVDGLMGGAPTPADVMVGSGLALVQLTYDTGIR